MNKPITVAREEYLNAIVDLTNGAGLPAFVKIDIINLVLDKLQTVAKEEYARDMAEWQKLQAAETVPKEQED